MLDVLNKYHYIDENNGILFNDNLIDKLVTIIKKHHDLLFVNAYYSHF